MLFLQQQVLEPHRYAPTLFLARSSFEPEPERGTGLFQPRQGQRAKVVLSRINSGSDRACKGRPASRQCSLLALGSVR